MTLGSLFDGSGGFPLAGLINGIDPVWASEIEPFPIRVTTKRMPWMKHYGDVSSMNGAEVEPVDIITFGSPCQDLSVAGKRGGLEGERSGLFHQAIRVIKEMRNKTNGKYPKYIVWENVPGAFSSNKGDDFRCVLEEICRIKDETAEIPLPRDKWTLSGEIVDGEHDYSVAWRVLDAQYWGVPQRRRRIFLVASFMSANAPEILFKFESLSGYSAESHKAWKEFARSTGESIGETGRSYGLDNVLLTGGTTFFGKGYHEDKSGCLCVGGIHGVCADKRIVLNDQGGNRMDVTEDQTTTLRAESHHPPIVVDEPKLFENHGQGADYTGPLKVSPTISAKFGTGGNNQPFVTETPKLFKNNISAVDYSGPEETCPTLIQRMGTGGNNQPLVAEEVIYSMRERAGKPGGGKGLLIQENRTGTVSTTNNQAVCVLEGNGSRPSHRGNGYAESDVMYTLNSVEQHQVAYSLACGNAKEDNKSRTLDERWDRVTSHQGGTVIAENPSYGLDRASFNQGKNAKFDFSVEEEKAPSMLAKGPGAVGTPVQKPLSFYPQMKAESMCFMEDTANTIVNGTNPGYQNGVMETDYIVRRLTPVECARLQGFPDWWCDSLETENPTEEDIEFWAEVFETHRKIVTGSSKPKTENQIIKWLKNPHTDSAEYKMWGNGVALPCVVFVLAGIKWAEEQKGAEDE